MITDQRRIEFGSIRTIVTHPGGAHRDEFMAVAFLLALAPGASVYRRDPGAADMADQTTAVVDVGGKHDPAFLLFDHHHLPRDHAPTCALTLVLDRMGLLPEARKAFLWFEYSEMMDSKGPLATAKWMGTNIDWLMTTMSPVETFMLRRFEQYKGDNALHPGDPFHALMVELGNEKIGYAVKLGDRLDLLNKKAEVQYVSAGNEVLSVIDASFVGRDADPVLGLELWVKENFPHTAVTITQDDRGTGFSLFRRNDHPRIDFSKLEGKPGVVFAHKNGFVAKIAAGVDPIACIEQAIK